MKKSEKSYRTAIISVFLIIWVLLGGCKPAPAQNAEQAAVQPQKISTLTAQPSTIPLIKTLLPMPTPTKLPESTTNNEADADVIFVKAILASNGMWSFNVTIKHPDIGWDDYTNGWDIVLPDGTVLKTDAVSEFTRVLLHPHVNEQPFNRSQSNLSIPSEVSIVIVRAHDLIHGFGGVEITVDLTKNSGEGFEVIRE